MGALIPDPWAAPTLPIPPTSVRLEQEQRSGPDDPQKSVFPTKVGTQVFFFLGRSVNPHGKSLDPAFARKTEAGGRRSNLWEPPLDQPVTRRRARFAFAAGLALALTSSAPAHAATPRPKDALASDIPKDFKPDETAYDYVRREVMIPMRDGVKLHAVIVIPKGARRFPILLDRTPYNAAKFAKHAASPQLAHARRPVRGRRGVRPRRLYPRRSRTSAANMARRAIMSSPGRCAGRSIRPRPTTPPTPGTRSTGSSTTSRRATAGSA